MQSTESNRYTVEIPAHSTLPMTDRMQSALLGWILRDDKVFLQVNQKLQPSWFLKGVHQRIYGLILKCYKQLQTVPTRAELENYKELVAEDNKVRVEIMTAIARAMADSEQIRWEAIKLELSDWLKSKILQDMIVKSAKIWNQGHWQQAAQIMSDGVVKYRDAQFEEGMEVRFEDPESYLEGQQINRDRALTTGSRLLDLALLDGATNGSLLGGDTTAIIAPVNIGKTTCMLTICGHNILAGKDVLFMSHEGRPEDLRLKLIRNILGASEPELLRLYKIPDGLNKIRQVTETISRHFTYVPYNRAGMTVEDVMPIIRRYQENRRAKYGKGYDLLVVDYPALLGTEKAANYAMRNAIEIVYGYYVQLALEYNFHIVVAIQTNREGSKVNKGLDTNRLLMMEDVQEAFGVPQKVTNVITLNRSVRAAREHWATFLACKSRSNGTGMAVVCRTDYARSMTHGPHLPSFAYMGSKTMEAVANLWLNDPNKNGKILDEKGQPIE